MTSLPPTGTDGPPHVVVVGGGLAGLSAAWELEPSSRAGLVTVDLFESSPRFGGAVATDEGSGLALEGGPDSFLTTKPEALDLCEELGLSGSLIGVRSSARGAYIYRGGKLHRIPPLLGVRTGVAVRGLLSTSLLSRAGKLRAALGAGLTRLWPVRLDERSALGPQLRSRFGDEAVEWLLEPFMAGVHPAPLDVLSPRAVASVLPARWSAAAGSVTPTRTSRGPLRRPVGVFASLRGGMEELPRSLVRGIHGARLHPSSAVRRVQRENGRFHVEMDNGEERLADGVILATSAPRAAQMLNEGLPRVAEGLASVRMGDSVVVALVYDRSQVPTPLDGSGVLVPRGTGLPISAITWLSAKWEQAADLPDAVALRAFLRVEGSGSRLPDEQEARSLVRASLQAVMGITASPRRSVVFVHRAILPWYEVGHLDRVAEIRRRLREWPSLELAGSSFDGIGLPDTIRSGRGAARRLCHLLEVANPAPASSVAGRAGGGAPAT